MITYALLLAFTVLIVFPLFWMLVTSFKPLSEVRRWPPTFLPETFTFFNYVDIWQQYPFARFLGNSFFISIMGTIGALISCTMAAAVLSAAPLLVLYIFAQQYIIESMALTGLKR